MATTSAATTVPSLSRYVPRVTLDWIGDSPERCWKSVDGSMVFADISGFTALSERLAARGRIGAEELVETLSRVFGGMLDLAADRRGQLLKFGGDALLFLFTGDDHVRQAASAAVEMRAELRRSTEIVTSVGKLALSVSIGVHSGAFDLFLVGERNRELVVLGPGVTAVVTAENAATAGQIVVSAATAAALPPQSVRTRDDGELLLRWRKPAVPPCGQLAARADDDDHAGAALPAMLSSSLGSDHTDPAHRVSTIAFMKFSGTDALLRELGPRDFARRLDATISTAQEAFASEDVALLCVDCDVDGGKIFCSSGVPLTSEDDEGRMLRAARAVLASNPPLPLQIGINRGHVFAAEIGTPRRATYSAMGDTTNTAARICGKAEVGAVYVHPSVLENARTLYESEPVGPFTFKGKTQPQTVYRLGDEIGHRDETRASDELPFVGRAGSLATMAELLGRIADGEGGSAVVTGPVGVGKTRLVREALSSVAETPVLNLAAEPYGASNAFRIFRDPLRSVLGVTRGRPAAMRDQLLASVRRLVPQHEPMLGLIADVLQIEVDPSDDVLALLPQYRPDRTADVIVDVLEARFVQGVVVVVDDAHWADDPSAHLVRRLAAAAAARPWVVVLTRRDDPGGIELDEPTVRLDLEPMSAELTRELTLAATEATPLRPHEVDQVVERAGGNPLFVGEIVRAAHELGSLDAVPESLQGAMAAQVDAIEPGPRRVLGCASVLGQSFRRIVLTEVLGVENVSLGSREVRQLGRFLENDGRARWRFKTGLLRDVVYDGLGFHLRARLHREAGEAVERISSDPSADAHTLALHFAAANDHERAFRYACLAAERSERSYAHATAAAQLEAALTAARRLVEVTDDEVRDLWIRLGGVREQAGLLDEAIEAYRHALRRTDDMIDRCDIRLQLAAARAAQGAYPTALGEATRTHNELASEQSDEAARLRARALAFSAYVRRRQERLDDAMRLAELAVRAAEDAGAKAALARAHGILSWAHLRLGRDDRVEYTRRALELFAEVGDLVGEAQMAGNLGVLSYYAGDWVETVEWYGRSERAFDRIGNVTGAAVARANIGEVLVSQGRYDEAEPILRDAARVLRVSGHFFAPFADMQLGRLLHARGELDRAEGLLRGSADENEQMGDAAGMLEATLHLARCRTVAGEPGAALASIERAVARIDEAIPLLEAARAVAETEALIAMGRIDAARKRVREGIEAARSRTLEFDLANLLLIEDRLTRDDRQTKDEPGAATPMAEEAAALLGRLGVVQIGQFTNPV